MLKFVALSTFLAVARAGNILSSGPGLTYSAVPLTYATAAVPAAPVAFHTPAIGASHQSIVRSLDGNAAISHYSKAVDTAFSSIRKVDTRITNDGKILTPGLSYTAVPALSYAHVNPTLNYATAPALSYAAHANPTLNYAAAPLPIVKTASALSYAAAPAISYTRVAPALNYAVAAPILKTAPTLGYAATPTLSYTSGTPIVKAASAVSYAPANVIAHTTFTGIGTSYAW